MFRFVFTGAGCIALLSLLAFSRATSQPAPPAAPSWLDPRRANVERLIAAAQADQLAWNRLAELTDTYGARFSGSDNLARAIVWASETMRKDGLEHVRGAYQEPVVRLNDACIDRACHGVSPPPNDGTSLRDGQG
ncbi:MAG TPA: hypothetical protein VMO26_17680 [Vicinamibacterales bacterium]|nr:hypothetical protein [Vicinamibacterales bacterium]